MNELNLYKWQVCIRCYTYNHSRFITDTMNGFCMQETTFPFICMIIDDCSTDGEQAVINTYLEDNFDLSNSSITRNDETEDFKLLFAQHKSNLNCFFVVLLLKYNHYRKKSKLPYIKDWLENSKYEAICEGDDYWIHPHKLQMQVDFLENNPDYSLVHTDFDLVHGKRKHYHEIFKDGNYFPGILNNNLNIGTLTVVLRLSTYYSLPRLYYGKNWPMSDFPLWIEFSYAAKIKYMDVVTSKYRVLLSSVSHNEDINQLIQFKESALAVRRFYANHYGVKLINNGYTKKYYLDMVRYAYRLKDKKVGAHYFKKALLNKRLSLKTCIYFLGLCFPLLRRFIGIH